MSMLICAYWLSDGANGALTRLPESTMLEGVGRENKLYKDMYELIETSPLVYIITTHFSHVFSLMLSSILGMGKERVIYKRV